MVCMFLLCFYVNLKLICIDICIRIHEKLQTRLRSDKIFNNGSGSHIYPHRDSSYREFSTKPWTQYTYPLYLAPKSIAASLHLYGIHLFAAVYFLIFFVLHPLIILKNKPVKHEQDRMRIFQCNTGN